MEIFLIVLVVAGVVTILARCHYLRKKEQEQKLKHHKRQNLLGQALGFPGAAGGQGALQQVIAYQQRLPMKTRSKDLDQLIEEGATFVGDVRPVEKDQRPDEDLWGEAVGQSTVQRR